jgi:hypothetical protein
MRFADHDKAIKTGRSVERDGRRFMLARYFDVHYARSGPEQLAAFLGRVVDDVFPIQYDLTPYSKGDAQVLRGSILREPREWLSRAELIKLAVPKLHGRRRK